MAVFAQFLSYRCAVTQTYACHHRTEPQKKLDLHLEYLFVGEIITWEPGSGYSWRTDCEPGCWVIPDFGLGHFYHWSKTLCASVFLHGDKDTGPWIKSVIKESHYDYNIILQAEQCAEAGSAAAELPQGVCAFTKGKKKLHRRICSYIRWGNWLFVKQPAVFIYCENLNLALNFPSRENAGIWLKWWLNAPEV